MNKNLSMMIALICTKGPAETYIDMLEHDEGFREFININKGKNRPEMIDEYKLNILLLDGEN